MPALETPDGYGTWLHEMEQAANDGGAALMRCLRQSPIDMLAHLEEARPGTWERLSQRAEQVDAKRASRKEQSCL